MVELEPVFVTPLRRGKFCRWFGPSSRSPGSLGVTPSLFKSIPSPPLEKMELPRIASPVVLTNRTTFTPLPPLPAMILPGAPGPGMPPIVLLIESATKIPSSALPNSWLPLISVPMKLPCTRLSCMDALSLPRLMPRRPFAEMTLRAPATDPPIVLNALRTLSPSVLPRATVPVAVVPMRFPWIVLLFAPC